MLIYAAMPEAVLGAATRVGTSKGRVHLSLSRSPHRAPRFCLLHSSVRMLDAADCAETVQRACNGPVALQIRDAQSGDTLYTRALVHANRDTPMQT